MRLGVMQTERLPLRFVFEVDMLQLLVHYFRERLCLLLRDLLVRELVVEMILGFLHIGKAHEELGLDTRLVLGLMHRIHELRFVEFLAGERHNTVHFRDHMDRRCIPEMAAYLNEVIHIVSEKTGIGRHVRAVTLAHL